MNEELLAAHILRQAAADLSSRDPRLRRDAERFFASTWYIDLLDFLELPPDRRPTI